MTLPTFLSQDNLAWILEESKIQETNIIVLLCFWSTFSGLRIMPFTVTWNLTQTSRHYFQEICFTILFQARNLELQQMNKLVQINSIMKANSGYNLGIPNLKEFIPSMAHKENKEI